MKPPYVDVAEPNEFDLKTPDELDVMIEELAARAGREDLPTAIVRKFTEKIRAEANRRRWRTTLAAERANLGG